MSAPASDAGQRLDRIARRYRAAAFLHIALALGSAVAAFTRSGWHGDPMGSGRGVGFLAFFSTLPAWAPFVVSWALVSRRVVGSVRYSTWIVAFLVISTLAVVWNAGVVEASRDVSLILSGLLTLIALSIAAVGTSAAA